MEINKDQKEDSKKQTAMQMWHQAVDLVIWANAKRPAPGKNTISTPTYVQYIGDIVKGVQNMETTRLRNYIDRIKTSAEACTSNLNTLGAKLSSTRVYHYNLRNKLRADIAAQQAAQEAFKIALHILINTPPPLLQKNGIERFTSTDEVIEQM